MDITPNIKIITYFETYNLINLKQFDNIQQAENYFLLNNGCGKHQKRKKFLNLSCKGKCLIFTKNLEEVNN